MTSMKTTRSQICLPVFGKYPSVSFISSLSLARRSLARMKSMTICSIGEQKLQISCDKKKKKNVKRINIIPWKFRQVVLI